MARGTSRHLVQMLPTVTAVVDVLTNAGSSSQSLLEVSSQEFYTSAQSGSQSLSNEALAEATVQHTGVGGPSELAGSEDLVVRGTAAPTISDNDSAGNTEDIVQVNVASQALSLDATSDRDTSSASDSQSLDETAEIVVSRAVSSQVLLESDTLTNSETNTPNILDWADILVNVCTGSEKLNEVESDYFVAGDGATGPPGYNVSTVAFLTMGELIEFNPGGDTTPPNPVLGYVNGATLVVDWSEVILKASTPNVGDFVVHADAGTVAVTVATIDQNRLTLTLASAVGSSAVVTLDYTPGTHPVEDDAYNTALPFTLFPCANGTAPPPDPSPDTTPPTPAAGYVNGTTLVLDWSEDLFTGSVPAPGAFTVHDNAAIIAVSGVGIYRYRLTLTLASAPGGGDTVTLDYAQPGTNPLEDLAANLAASFSAFPIANGVPAPPPPPPPRPPPPGPPPPPGGGGAGGIPLEGVYVRAFETGDA